MQQICDFHLRFIKSVCCENQCQSKLLCDECVRGNGDHTGHRLVDVQQFMNHAESFLKGGQYYTNPDVVLYGADLNAKTKIYINNTQEVKMDMQKLYVTQLEEQIQKYIHQLVDGVRHIKKMLVDFVTTQIGESFSASILSDRECSHSIVKAVYAALEQKISTKDANHLLYRLHTGQLEKEYQERKIKGLVELFQQHLKAILEPVAMQVHQYIKQFGVEMEKVKQQVKTEHFTLNSMTSRFRIKEIKLNQNLQMHVDPPEYMRKHNISQPPPIKQEILEEALRIKKIPKHRKIELLRSLDFTQQSARSDLNMQSVSQIAPLRGQLDSGTTDLKRIVTVNGWHTGLVDVCNIQGNICLSVGKEGTVNIFTIQFEGNEIQVINKNSMKPHQELRYVEMCQTPGMFLTVGRNIKITNEKYIDLGYIVKLFLYQDLKNVELLTEFRDLHSQPIDRMKFINENYIRSRVEYSKFSNELEFATQSADTIKVWKFSYDSAKIYEGEMNELYKIELKGISNFEHSNGHIVVSTKQSYQIFNKTHQVKQQNLVKDQIVRTRSISNNRILLLTQQGILTVLDMGKSNSEPQKIHLKKYLRQILFEKEDKELELIDCIQVNQKFIVFMHSTQYDHFLILNKNFDVIQCIMQLENRYRYPPSEIRQLVYLELDKLNLMITMEGKNDFCLWDINVK